MQNDIFTKCIDPADYLSLKELKDKQTKDDQDEVMSDAQAVEEQPVIENGISNFEEDYYQCLVAKPKNAADFPHQADEDLDMLELLPEQNEPILYELVNKVATERKRKLMLLDPNVNMRYIKETDILLNEK